MEQWSVITDFPNYEVSTRGQIRHSSVNKSVKTYHDHNGYYSTELYKNGKRSDKRVHRLVAEAFIPNPNGLPEVNHKDGNKHNNNVENLEWVSKSDNMKHAFATGLAKPSRGMLGKKNPNAGRKGLPIKIVETGEVFSSSIECERKKGLNNRHINDCLKGRQKTHGGYHFQYI